MNGRFETAMLSMHLHGPCQAELHPILGQVGGSKIAPKIGHYRTRQDMQVKNVQKRWMSFKDVPFKKDHISVFISCFSLLSMGSFGNCIMPTGRVCHSLHLGGKFQNFPLNSSMHHLCKCGVKRTCCISFKKVVHYFIQNPDYPI